VATVIALCTVSSPRARTHGTGSVVKIKYPWRASKRIVISVACNCISAFIPVSQFAADNVGPASVCARSLCALERN